MHIFPILIPKFTLLVKKFQKVCKLLNNSKLRVSKGYSGKVATYKILAEVIGHPKAYRAVGSALRKNPFAPEVHDRLVAYVNFDRGFIDLPRFRVTELSPQIERSVIL